MNSTSELFDNKPDRPKRKSSYLAVCATVLLACCLIMMNVRGVPDEERLKDPSRYVTQTKRGIAIANQPCLYQHGWPAIWSESESNAVYKPTINVSQGSLYIDSPEFADGWLGRIQFTSVSFQGLAINLAVILFAPMFAFLFFQFRGRKTRGINFSLLEIGVLVAGICVTLAWYQSHFELYEAEETAISRIYGPGKDQHCFRRWCGPGWLRCLAGAKGQMRVFRHVDRIRLNENSNTEAEMASEFGQFRYLRDLDVKAIEISPEVLEAMSKLPHVKQVAVSQGSVPGSRNKSVLQLRKYFPKVTDMGVRVSASK